MINRTEKKEESNASRFLSAMLSAPTFLGGEAGLTIWNEVNEAAMKEENSSKSLDELMQQPIAYPFIGSDRPDIRFSCDSFVLGIECFDFDASEKTKGGSLLKMENARVSKLLSDRHYKTGDRVVREKLDVELNYSNYIDSAIKTFEKHVKKIPEYRANLQKMSNGRPYYLAFCMEDKTTLGSYAITEKGIIEPVCILCVREFLEKLRNC